MLDRADVPRGPARGRHRGRRAHRRVDEQRAVRPPDPALSGRRRRPGRPAGAGRDLQADRRRTTARRLPGRHAGPPRGRRLAGVGGDGLGHRPPDGAARRAVRERDGPGLRRARRGGRRRRDGHRGRPAAAAHGRLRCGGQQHRPQGRPHPAGRRAGATSTASTTASRSRSCPSCGPCCGAGVASRSTADERAGLDRLRRCLDEDPLLGAELRALLSPIEVRALSRRVDALLAEGRFPYPSPTWPAVPWPPF